MKRNNLKPKVANNDKAREKLLPPREFISGYIKKESRLQPFIEILSKYTEMDYSFDDRHLQRDFVDALTIEFNLLEGRHGTVIEAADDKGYLELIKQLPIAVYSCDNNGKILFYNDTATALWGRKPEIGKDLWCGSWQIYNTDGELIPHHLCPMAIALQEGVALRDIEIIIKRPDGKLHQVLPHAIPVFNNQGELTGAFNVLIDTTASRLLKLEKHLSDRLQIIFNGNKNLTECLHDALEEICLFMGKQVAQAWTPNFDASGLQLLAQYSTTKSTDENRNLNKTVNIQDSFPGKIFKEKKFISLQQNKNGCIDVDRNSKTENPYLSVSGFPVIVKNEVIAALIFYNNGYNCNKVTLTELGENLLSSLAVNIQRKKTDEELKHIYNLSHDLLCQVGLDGYFSSVNPAFCNAFGYTKEELCKMKYADLIHPDDLRSANELGDEMIAGKHTISFENRFISRDGQIKWLSWTASPILSRGIIIGIAKDVSEKKELQIKEALHNKRISVILESITDGFCAIAKDWTVTYWNKTAESISSISRNDIIGKNLWEVYKEAVSLKFYEEYHRAMRDNVVVHFQEYFEPNNNWVEVTAYPSDLGLSVYFKDITDRMNQFEALEKNEIQIRNFATQLNNVIEDERSRIAHEIHDDLGQQLSGIKMSLSSLKKQLAGNNMIETKVGEMMNDINSTIESLRKFATELRLGILDTLGLVPSIEWLVKEFEKKSSIKCRLEIDAEDYKYEKSFSTNIFRICQEALTNIFKHAEATEVNVQLIQMSGTLSLKIEDNGIGIVDDKLNNPFSIGLVGIRQRSDLLNAKLVITSKPRSGTSIHILAKTND